MKVMVILPALAWLGCYRLVRQMAGRGGIDHDWRLATLLATTAWAALVVLITELLSLATALNAPALQLSWGLATVFLWLGVRRMSGVAAMPVYARNTPQPAEDESWPLDVKLMLGATLTLAALLGGIALLTPTTNWDSMTYHLSRVMHWMQNQCVAHFPTNMEGQNQMGPWSGFVQAHLWLLWGGDRLANLIQWLAMIQCALAASLLVRQLLPSGGPARLRAEVFAALLVVTLPIGVVESISTQTDLTTSVWLLALAALALEYGRQPERRVYAAALGAVGALGALTKITFAIFALPLVVAAAGVIAWQNRKSLPRLLVPSALAIAVCLVLVSPHLLRNHRTFGSSVGSQAAVDGHGIARITVNGTMSNLIRNLALHANTGVPPLTRALNKMARSAQQWTGRPADDPELNAYGGEMKELPDQLRVFDSMASCPWHVALIGVAFVIALVRGRHHSPLALAAIVSLAGFVLFCALLRWQPWNSRYHLPWLNLFMPIVAAAVVPRLPRLGTGLLGFGLLAFAVVIVANNQSRPVFDPAFRALPRVSQMLYCHGRHYEGPLREVVRLVTAVPCRKVGLKLWPDDPEYPLWLMLREAGFQGRISHQFVAGPSARIPGPEEVPDVVITAQASQPEGDDRKRFPYRENIEMFCLYWSAEAGKHRLQLPE